MKTPVQKIQTRLHHRFPALELTALADARGVVTLSGQCESWQQLVDAGHAAAHVKGVKNIVSEMTVRDMELPRKDYTAMRAQGSALGETDSADVVIVGAGVTGSAVARSLARYNLDVLVLEMSDDVATGASKANNGNIHAGHAATPGTLKAKLNVEGNRMYTQWAEELGFALQRCGAMGVISKRRYFPLMLGAYLLARTNHVDGVKIVGRKKAYALEPKLRTRGIDVKAGLWLPSFGLVEPYEVVVALAENAAENGVRFRFGCTVADVLTENGTVTSVVTNQGLMRAKCIINCAGVYADEISAMAGDKSYTIHARKGTIAILDKNAAPEFDCLCEIVTADILKQKNKQSKGGGMCRTPEYNILLGPSATETPDKEDTQTTPEDLAYAMGRNQNASVSYGNIIRIFAGARPADFKEDFVIERSAVTHGFLNCGGIQSPGLAAAPAIAKMVTALFCEEWEAMSRRMLLQPLREKENYNPRRAPKRNFRSLTHAQQDALIAQNPAYGRVVCRCETITEGEILDAIRSPLVPATVDAIKRRTRAGMGRCQGGFCQPRVLELLARELGRDWVDIHLCDGGAGTNEQNGGVGRILLAHTRPDAVADAATQKKDTPDTQAAQTDRCIHSANESEGGKR